MNRPYFIRTSSGFINLYQVTAIVPFDQDRVSLQLVDGSHFFLPKREARELVRELEIEFSFGLPLEWQQPQEEN